jgi:uncharacterized membrane protein HdeD (DUF308 family)
MNTEVTQRRISDIWWQVLLRGGISLALGLMMLALPQASVRAYVEIFGAYALTDGFLLIMQVLPVRKLDKRAGSRLLHGIVGVTAGAAVFLWPGFRELGMSNIFSMYLMLTGVLQVFSALDLYSKVSQEYYLIASGFLSILCGLLVRIAPVNDAVEIARIFGVFMAIYAILVIFVALKIRQGAIAYTS